MRTLSGAPPMSDAFGVRGRVWLAHVALPVDERLTVDGCIRHIDMLDQEIALVECAIARQVLACSQMRSLLMIPGVNAVTACTLHRRDPRHHPFSDALAPCRVFGARPARGTIRQRARPPRTHLQAGAGRGAPCARGGGLAPVALRRADARISPARACPSWREHRHRRRRAQARGDCVAHAHQGRGLRICPPLAHAREAHVGSS